MIDGDDLGLLPASSQDRLGIAGAAAEIDHALRRLRHVVELFEQACAHLRLQHGECAVGGGGARKRATNLAGV